MALSKRGSPVKMNVIKKGGFVMDPNFLAELLLKDWPDKVISMDALHDALKSVGIVDYQAEDLTTLINRLGASGFKITQ